MIIRINDKSGNNIAECELLHHDTGVWYVQHKANILNVFNDLELLNEETEEYTEVIDIDIDNLYSPKKIDLIKGLAGAWTEWEVLRSEYHLYSEDDYKYAIEIIYKALLYDFISEETYLSYIKQLKEFLGWEDDTYFTNDTYTYEDLDNFIYKLNPIYKIW